MIESYIKKHFIYNQYSGNIQRFDRDNSNGSLDKDGYLIIKVKGKQYKAHRIAWLLHYGEWPKKVIDHINGKKLDNRISNLRDVHQSINVENTKRTPNRNTGVVGVYIDNTNGLLKKFAIKIKGKTQRFYTIEEALLAKQK